MASWGVGELAGGGEDLCALVVGEHPDLCALVVDLVRVLVVVEHPEKLTDLAFESFPGKKTTIR